MNTTITETDKTQRHRKIIELHDQYPHDSSWSLLGGLKEWMIENEDNMSPLD